MQYEMPGISHRPFVQYSSLLTDTSPTGESAIAQPAGNNQEEMISNA